MKNNSQRENRRRHKLLKIARPHAVISFLPVMTELFASVIFAGIKYYQIQEVSSFSFGINFE